MKYIPRLKKKYKELAELVRKIANRNRVEIPKALETEILKPIDNFFILFSEKKLTINPSFS